ncbi:MAG: PEGA domain-containing protein [Candidatus Riflebacteria bacterium]|nr:PEGA domain-containing protein [Candidatus Riflebacteria bacterium]
MKASILLLALWVTVPAVGAAHAPGLAATGAGALLSPAQSGAGEPGPGRLLKARGSSWVWFLDSFGTRHRIASSEVLKKWWAEGPRVEELSPAELDRFQIGEEIDYGTNPYTYVISRDSRVIKARLGTDPLVGRLNQVLTGESAAPATPSPAATPAPASAAAPSPRPPPVDSRDATLIITSDPSGAAVLRPHDGHRYGETPLTLRLKPQTLSFTFLLKGHLKRRKQVTLAPGQTQELAVRLSPAPGHDSQTAIAPAQNVPFKWIALGAVEALLRPVSGQPTVAGVPGFAGGLTQVFRLSLPGGMSAALPSPGAGRAAGFQSGQGLWLLSLPRDGAATLRLVTLPSTLGDNATLFWVSDRDLLLAEPSGQERLLLNTETLSYKKPREGAVPRAADPRARAWLHGDVIKRRPEALQRLTFRNVPGEAGVVAGLTLSPDGRLLAGVNRENQRQPLIMSMASGQSIALPEPGEDLGGATLSWLVGDRLLFTLPARGSFVLSLEAIPARTVQEMATTLASANQLEASTKMLQKLIRYYPGAPEARDAQGELARLEQKLAATRAAEHLARGKEAVVQGNQAAAVDELKKAAAFAGVPAGVEARELLGRLEVTRLEEELKRLADLESTDPEGALKWLKALAQRPLQEPMTSKVAAALATLEKRLALAREQERKAREAREIEEKRRRAAEQYTRALELLYAGRRAEALTAVKATISLDPTHAAGQKLVAQLSQPPPPVPGPTAAGPAPGASPQSTPAPGATTATARPVGSPAASGAPIVRASASPGPGALQTGVTTGGIRETDLPLCPGSRWVYSLGPGTLTRSVLGPVRLKGEVAVLVGDRIELPGARPMDRLRVLATRPGGLFLVAQGERREGPFRSTTPEEPLIRFPATVGSEWGKPRAHVGVIKEGPIATLAGTLQRSVTLEETAKYRDGQESGTKLLTYHTVFAPGVGLVRRSLKRATGADRPIFELSSFEPGQPRSGTATTPTTAAGGESTQTALPEIRLGAPPVPAPEPAQEVGPRENPGEEPVSASAAPARPPPTASPAQPAPGSDEEISEEEALLRDKGDAHFRQAKEHLARRFPIQARSEIESALSFDPGNREFQALKRRILGELATHSPFGPELFRLGEDVATVVLTFGAPDRIEPTASSIQLDRVSVPYDLILTYRGAPFGAIPVDSEAEARDEEDVDAPETRQCMALWRLFVKSGRVVARQVNYRGDYGKANFPFIGRHVAGEILAHPHGEISGALANTRLVTWDMGVVHLRASVLALPKRRYRARQGYVFEPPKSINDYRVTRTLAYLDPEINEAAFR